MNTQARVPRLNADRVDGLSASQLARTGGRTGAVDYSGQLVDATGDGIGDTVVAIARCPAGTQMTGGGIEDYTSTGVVVFSSPAVNTSEGWIVAVAIAQGAGDTGSDVTANAVCYNPLGSVPGAHGRARQTEHAAGQVTPALARKIRAVAAQR